MSLPINDSAQNSQIEAPESQSVFKSEAANAWTKDAHDSTFGSNSTSKIENIDLDAMNSSLESGLSENVYLGSISYDKTAKADSSDLVSNSESNFKDGIRSTDLSGTRAQRDISLNSDAAVAIDSNERLLPTEKPYRQDERITIKEDHESRRIQDPRVIDRDHEIKRPDDIFHPRQDHDEARHQFDNGFKYLDKTDNHIDRALDSIKDLEPKDAAREIKRAMRNLGRGVDDFEDGVDNLGFRNRNDNITDGIDSFDDVSEELKWALESLEEGDIEGATEALREAKLALLNGKFTTEYGVDKALGSNDTESIALEPVEKPLYEPLHRSNWEIRSPLREFRLRSPMGTGGVRSPFGPDIESIMDSIRGLDPFSGNGFMDALPNIGMPEPGSFNLPFSPQGFPNFSERFSLPNFSQDFGFGLTPPFGQGFPNLADGLPFPELPGNGSAPFDLSSMLGNLPRPEMLQDALSPMNNFAPFELPGFMNSMPNPELPFDFLSSINSSSSIQVPGLMDALPAPPNPNELLSSVKKLSPFKLF